MSIAEIMNIGGGYEKPKFYGVTVAVVTDIEDPEGFGRIKVKLLNRDISDYETDFIRIVTPMTGKEWGMFFFPEIGDEVLVCFSDGDVSRPYVIGSLWNQNYKPPVTIKDQKNLVRKIKTKNGHELIFHDEDDKDSITIKTPKNLHIELQDEKEIIEISDSDGKNFIKIDVKNGTTTVIAEKKIKLQTGNSKVEIDGSGDSITIESPKSLVLKSQQISISAKSTLSMDAKSNLNIKSDGPVKIAGAVTKIN